MYHYKARIYSPTLGRFLQTDPIGYDDQVNLYAYVGDDPLNSSDPSGEKCDQLGGGANCGFFEGFATFVGTIYKSMWEGIKGGDPDVAVAIAVGDQISRATDGRPQTASDEAAESSTSAAMGGKRSYVDNRGYANNTRNSIGPGKAYATGQRRDIYAQNRARNGGVLRSDKSGTELKPSMKSVRGASTPPDAAQIDHHNPKSRGGPNSGENARVLSAEENRRKSNTPPDEL